VLYPLIQRPTLNQILALSSPGLPWEGGGGAPADSRIRITEDGEARITEDGEARITET
jgi:hypothetical protein